MLEIIMQGHCRYYVEVHYNNYYAVGTEIASKQSGFH